MQTCKKEQSFFIFMPYTHTFVALIESAKATVESIFGFYSVIFLYEKSFDKERAFDRYHEATKKGRIRPLEMPIIIINICDCYPHQSETTFEPVGNVEQPAMKSRKIV